MYGISRRQLVQGSIAAALAGCYGRAPSSADEAAADTVVTAADELQAAFRSLAPGETIRISAAGAPYRTTDWLDIDEDGVTVVGPGIKHLVVPADGADVGGIRIGHSSHCEDIDVRWIGFHGNPDGQSSDAIQRHGLVVRDAANVTLQGNYVTRTHPYHVHNGGGSGISVGPRARHVRLLFNRVEDIGDRGIQVGGDGIVIAGNIVTDGFDRSISLDIPPPDGGAMRARNVTVTENLLGNNQEGSLVGIGGDPPRADRGHFTISNNIGFGKHKHFCHLGFGGLTQDVQVEGNVSFQDADNGLAGVSVDIEQAVNVAIRNNAFHGYSGRGINIAGDITDFTVSGNAIYNPGASGVRIAGARDGTVADNYIQEPGKHGIALDAARYVSVNGNRIRQAAGAGILVLAGEQPGYHTVADNYVRSYGTATDAPAIDVHDTSLVVRENRLLAGSGPAIVERDSAANNRYAGNRAEGSSPWAITAPSSVVRDNMPPIDSYPGVSAAAGRELTIRFEKPYAEPPGITFGRRGGGIEDVAFETDDAGNFTGVDVRVMAPGTPVDLFVDGGGR